MRNATILLPQHHHRKDAPNCGAVRVQVAFFQSKRISLPSIYLGIQCCLLLPIIRMGYSLNITQISSVGTAQPDQLAEPLINVIRARTAIGVKFPPTQPDWSMLKKQMQFCRFQRQLSLRQDQTSNIRPDGKISQRPAPQPEQGQDGRLHPVKAASFVSVADGSPPDLTSRDRFP